MEYLIKLLPTLNEFFLYSVLAIFAQNAMFSRSLGVSRLIKLVNDPAVDTLVFGALLMAIQLISAPLSYLANIGLSYIPEWQVHLRPLAFVLCSAVAFFIVLFFIATVFDDTVAKNVVAVLPMATFNCSVLGTLLISSTQYYTIWQSIAFAVGSSIGYVFAVLIVTEGQRKLKAREIPQSFKGLPITLVYIGIIAIAIYGFTGHTVAR